MKNIFMNRSILVCSIFFALAILSFIVLILCQWLLHSEIPYFAFIIAFIGFASSGSYLAALRSEPPPAEHGRRDPKFPADLFQRCLSLEALHHHFEFELRIVLFAFRCHAFGPFLVCFFHCLFYQVRDRVSIPITCIFLEGVEGLPRLYIPQL